MEKLFNIDNKNNFNLKNIFSRPFFWPFIFLLLSIIILFLFSFFYPIPTEVFNSQIGLGSELLNIGDRSFYLYDQNNLNSVKPAPLYPFILLSIKKFVSIWGFNEFSKLWNFIVISITSILALFSLFFISNTAWQLFGRRAALISSWVYVLCPYTLFFSLSGSLSNYIFFGVSYICWIISRSKIFNKYFEGLDTSKTLIHLSIASLYLSSLRVTGSFFSIIILLPTFIFSLKNYSKNKYPKVNIFSMVFASATIFYCLWQINESYNYVSFSLKHFASEPGYFMGVERQYLRSRLNLENESIISNLKKLFLLALWKLSDFVTGINDIRDTHTQFNNLNYDASLLPFLIRVFTGVFYFVPINVVSFLSIIKFRKTVFKSGFWLVIIASLIIISPSLIGVSNSRYLFMVYTPFIIFSSALFSELFIEK